MTNERTIPKRRFTAALLAAVAAAAMAFWSAGPADAATGYTIAGTTDWDHDGHQDIIAVENATGDLWLYPGESKRGYSTRARVKIGNGWNTFTIGGLADWDHDGNQDIIAVDNATGLLWLYPGESRRGYSTQPRVKIGNGWNVFPIAGVADWDHDGHQDIIAVESNTGDLWLYPGESRRGYSTQPREKIGNGWNTFPVGGLTDWDRDGHQDIIATDSGTGLLWLYPGESRRGYSTQPRVQIGNGW